MARIRSEDTKPEIMVRRIVSALGIRYRLHRKDLPGKPDLYIGRIRTALFVHGCFWHQHECKAGNRRPKSRRDYWLPKLRANVARDHEVAERLREVGVHMICLWTCQMSQFPEICRDVAAEYYRVKPGTK